MSFSSDNTQIYNQLPVSLEFPEVTDPDFIETLTDNIKGITNAVNSKEGGLYDLTETANSEQWFISGDTQNFRNGYRMVVDFGALPDTASKSVAHGIDSVDSSFRITRFYASASDPTNLDYIPIPYASSTSTDIVELSMDDTNVTITTGSDRTSFTECYVVIDYVRN